MAVKIRLRRMGSKKRPFYRLVAADSRRARDGRFVEMLGYYDPLKEPADIKLDDDKIYKWLDRGATPTENASSLLRKAGLLEKWQLLKEGVKLTELESVIEERRAKQPEAKPKAQKEKELKEKAEAQKKEEEEKAEEAEKPKESSQAGQAGEKEEEKAEQPEEMEETEETAPAEEDEKRKEKSAEEQEQENEPEEDAEKKTEDKEKGEDPEESAETENQKDKEE